MKVLQKKLTETEQSVREKENLLLVERDLAVDQVKQKECELAANDTSIRGLHEELTTSKREVSEQRQIAKEAVEKLAEMEKAKVFVNYFSVSAYLLKCVCRQRMLRTFPRHWLPRKKCFRPRTMIMRAFRPS